MAVSGGKYLVCVWLAMRIHMWCVRMYVCVHVCVYVYMYLCIYVYMCEFMWWL